MKMREIPIEVKLYIKVTDDEMYDDYPSRALARVEEEFAKALVDVTNQILDRTDRNGREMFEVVGAQIKTE